MREIIYYIKSLFLEASEDPFFKALGSATKYLFYASLIGFFIYQGYLTYSNSVRAKQIRSTDMVFSLQGIYDQMLEDFNNEELKNKFLEVFSNYPNTVEPYKTISSIYAALFYEKLGDQENLRLILQDQSSSSSSFWRDICPLVSARFNLDIKCPEGGKLTATVALKESLKLGSDDHLKKVLEVDPLKRDLIEPELFETLKKVILGIN